MREVLDTIAGGLSVQLASSASNCAPRRRARPRRRPLHGLLDVLVGRRDANGSSGLDEFADVADVDGLEALLRTHLQHHYRDLASSSPGPGRR